MNEKTIKFYNENAIDYSNSTINIDIDDKIRKDIFLRNLKFGDKILDVGCGSGRDMLFFKNLGFQTVGIDASSELVAIARENTKSDVHNISFDQINWKNEFDGIWCMASLLHLKKSELFPVLKKLNNALKEDGSFYASFKVGNGEKIDDNGRFFSYYQPEELLKIFNDTNMFKSVEFSITGDNKGRINTQWLNIKARSINLTLDNKNNFKKLKY